jgi:hypothetical protein
VSLANPEEQGTLVLRIVGAVGHNAGMAHATNFKLALARTIKPTAGAGVALATLEDAARFIALMKPFRQARFSQPSCFCGPPRLEKGETLRQQPPRWSERCGLRGGCDAARSYSK